MAARKDIGADEVRQLLNYDSENGTLTWRERPRSAFKNDKDWKTFNTRYAGKVAGCIRADGYTRVTINYQRFYCHQIAWLIIYGEWPYKNKIYLNSVKASRKKNPPPNRLRIKTAEERRIAQREASARWLAKPGNKEIKRAVEKKYKSTPKAKEANRLRQLDYAAKNREQERLRAAEWRKNFPDKDREMHRNYYIQNRDKVRAASKAHRLANIEAYREYNRQYKHAKRAGGGKLSRGYLKRLMAEQNGLCLACGCDLSVMGHHLDHKIPLSKGGLHCDENVQLLCPMCNRRKSDKDFDGFLAQLKREKGGGE